MSKPRRYRPEPSRPPVLAIALAAVGLVVVIGVVIAVAAGSGDDDGGGEVAEVFGPVQVDGDALAPFTSPAADPAVGEPAPSVTGEAPGGERVEIGAGGEVTLVTFLAHWCPHCQAELPVLVDLAEQGAFEGVRTVAVLTGSSSDAPNFPPVPWLEREGWDGDVLLDDESAAAAAAYGLSSYPFLVVLDDEGRVVARASGEVPADDVVAMVGAA